MIEKTKITKLTPNIKALMIQKMSAIIIPKGSKPTIESVVDGLKNTNAVAQEALAWVETAIDAVKQAYVASGEVNPYNSDEEIAGEIMRQVKEKELVNKSKNATSQTPPVRPG